MNRVIFYLHGAEIGSATSETKKDARKSAAYAAISFIQSHREDLKSQCDCEMIEEIAEVQDEQDPDETTIQIPKAPKNWG